MQQYFLIKESNKYKLNENDLYHLKVVLRAKDGYQFIGVLDDKLYLASYKVDGSDYYIELICEMDRDSELKVDIKVYQALIRNENFDLVIQKVTELGAHEIVPTIFERNVVKIDKTKEESKINRYQSIVNMAVNQSKRDYIPKVEKPLKVKDILLEEGEIGLVAYENNKDTKSLSDLKEAIKSAKKVSIVIGPEGGITKDEYESLINKGFKSISLGKRILRSETASISLMSILSYIIECE